jgi:RNAse (barnase) inhibitor barstar
VEPFLFRSDPSGLVTADDAALRVGSDISSRHQLFERYAAGLSFPDYFGDNWDALDECLRDLHWVRQKRVVILHEDLPRLPENEMGVYIAILARAVEDWFGDEAHELQVVFPESAEHHVRDLMGRRGE